MPGGIGSLPGAKAGGLSQAIGKSVLGSRLPGGLVQRPLYEGYNLEGKPCWLREDGGVRPSGVRIGELEGRRLWRVRPSLCELAPALHRSERETEAQPRGGKSIPTETEVMLFPVGQVCREKLPFALLEERGKDIVFLKSICVF